MQFLKSREIIILQGIILQGIILQGIILQGITSTRYRIFVNYRNVHHKYTFVLLCRVL